jgi:DNA-binding NarL/FixJ family response regulator
MKIVIVDGQEVFRAGLKQVLSATPRFEVVGEAAAARPAFALIDTYKPDLVVLDLILPGMDGCAAAREIARRLPSAHLLALTTSDSPQVVLDAFDAGFHGYALKTQPVRALIDAFRQVERGDRYVAPDLASVVALGRRGQQNTLMGLLSEREREVFRLATAGLSNVQIAAELCISRKTVETHRYRVLKKLAVRNIAGLVRLAAEHGLIPRSTATAGLAANRPEELNHAPPPQPAA